ncbi:hydroxyisourate hydrolase [Halarchaeum salinum]|uniref:hydroxyisourate hydrolase n=1 Tax=Halarchaeum salinum TaxID=489912 RepID=A0AAV3S863_9EURY
MSAGLTTHVLDTSREGPAEGVDVILERVDESGDDEMLVRATTNADGRVDDPLLSADEMVTGTYRLRFEVGAYYRAIDAESSFLETVPVRFVIDDVEEHYHVPLLLSPGGYTTYRGS